MNLEEVPGEEAKASWSPAVKDGSLGHENSAKRKRFSPQQHAPGEAPTSLGLQAGCGPGTREPGGAMKPLLSEEELSVRI